MFIGVFVIFCVVVLGFNKGFDDFYFKLFDLVIDNRKYEVISKEKEKFSGIGNVKWVLNVFYVEMMEGGYFEGYVYEDGEVSFMIVV